MSGSKYYVFLAVIFGVGIYSVSQINGTNEGVVENSEKPEEQRKQAKKDFEALEEEYNDADEAEEAADAEDDREASDDYDDETYDSDDGAEEDVNKIGE